jgi:Fe-S-cluster containining protein
MFHAGFCVSAGGVCSALYMSDLSPCLSCGACCASFRVSFYWGELEDAGGCVPVDFTERVNLHRACIKGTNQPNPRCVALAGTVGEAVHCTIYENRPSPCREFEFSHPGLFNEACDRARARFGLPPLVEEEWGLAS